MQIYSTDKVFQMFLKMKDSEVKKILDRHVLSPKYVNYFRELHRIAGRAGNTYLTSGGKILRGISGYRYSFDDYLKDKNDYKNQFFRNIGTEATVDYVRRRAEFYYGEDNVWVDKDANSVVIKFPEVLIQNSVDDSHLMKDIFIKIYCYEKFGSISLARTTILDDEYKRYIFSHNSNYMPGLYSNQLCFGATQLRNWVDEAQGNNNFVIIDKIIASLEGYLSWESLEGRPYCYMSTIRKPIIDGNSIYYHKHEEQEIALKIIYNSDLKLEYKLENGSNFEQVIQITNKEDIKNLLKDSRLTQYYEYGGYSYETISKRKISERLESQVKFKDEYVPVVVEESQYQPVFEKSCHVRLLQYVIGTLEQELLKFIKENVSN